MSANKPEDATQSSEWAQANLADWERHMAQVKDEHPEFEVDLENKWWVPLVELQEHINSLDQQTREKYNDWAVEYLQINFDPERLPAMREEIKAILAAHPEISDQVEKIYFSDRALTRAREHVVSEIEAGREPFPGVCGK
ncbi:hypothetical protein BJX70DRAFT_401115 [Aspergillus crustosus]